MYKFTNTSPLSPAELALSPDADDLVLVGQVLPIAPIVVVALDGVCALIIEEVLCAALRGQVTVVA